MNTAKGNEERVKKLVLTIGKASLPRRQLVAEMGLMQGSRHIFRNNYLKPACERGLVEKKFGNVPTKPEQTYRLTAKGLAFWEAITKPHTPKEEKAKPCSNNQVDCPCAKEGCPRHGKCSECVAHHKVCAAHASADHLPKLPACLRGIAWQA